MTNLGKQIVAGVKSNLAWAKEAASNIGSAMMTKTNQNTMIRNYVNNKWVGKTIPTEKRSIGNVISAKEKLDSSIKSKLKSKGIY